MSDQISKPARILKSNLLGTFYAGLLAAFAQHNARKQSIFAINIFML